jgi:hypothetical protein
VTSDTRPESHCGHHAKRYGPSETIGEPEHNDAEKATEASYEQRLRDLRVRQRHLVLASDAAEQPRHIASAVGDVDDPEVLPEKALLSAFPAYPDLATLIARPTPVEIIVNSAIDFEASEALLAHEAPVVIEIAVRRRSAAELA